MNPLNVLVVLLVVLVLLEIAISIGCALYVRHRYGKHLVRSVLWDRLLASQFRTVVAGMLLYGLAFNSVAVTFLHLWSPLPRGWSTIILLVGLALLFWGPPADLRMLRSLGNGHSRGR